MENDFSAVVEDLPGFRRHRDRLEAAVELGEPDHEVGNDVKRDMVRRQRPVQTGGLGADVDAKDFLPGSFGGTGARRQNKDKTEQPQARPV